jgi:hypothetical protein
MTLYENKARATLESTGLTSTTPISGGNAEIGLLISADGSSAEPI